eukprot:scaffold625_cov324-Pavlova_lutheri.AAC.64
MFRAKKERLCGLSRNKYFARQQLVCKRLGNFPRTLADFVAITPATLAFCQFYPQSVSRKNLRTFCLLR